MAIVLMLALSVVIPAMRVQAPASPTVSVVPSNPVANPTESFTVNITIANAPAIEAWHVKLRWNPAVLEFPPGIPEAEEMIKEGPFLNDTGPTKFVVAKPNLIYRFVEFGCHLLTNVTSPPSGSGVLANVAFYVKESGVTNITILEARLVEHEDGEVLNVVLQSAYFHTTKPFVDFTWDPVSPEIGEIATFDASACWDPDGGSITQYSWDFDDGSAIVNTANPEVNHTFASYSDAGYLVNLTVTDDESDTWSKTKTLRMWHDVALADQWLSIVDNSNPYWWFDTVDFELGWADQIWDLVTVSNLGTYTEQVDVTLYLDKDASVIGDELKAPWVWWDGLDFVPGFINELPPYKGSGWLLPFLVDLIYLTPGTWTLTAVASPVPGETNLANNNLTLQITLDAPPVGYVIGDLNFDGEVNIVDIVSAALAFGTVPGDEVLWSEPAAWYVWHWKADINRDLIINIIDLVNIAVRFGQTW